MNEKTKHKELIREYTAQTGVVLDEKEIRYCEALLSLADNFDDIGRKDRLEGRAALSSSYFQEFAKREFQYFSEAAEYFGKLLEAYYTSGYEEDGANA